MLKRGCILVVSAVSGLCSLCHAQIQDTRPLDYGKFKWHDEGACLLSTIGLTRREMNDRLRKWCGNVKPTTATASEWVFKEQDTSPTIVTFDGQGRVNTVEMMADERQSYDGREGRPPHSIFHVYLPDQTLSWFGGPKTHVNPGTGVTIKIYADLKDLRATFDKWQYHQIYLRPFTVVVSGVGSGFTIVDLWMNPMELGKADKKLDVDAGVYKVAFDWSYKGFPYSWNEPKPWPTFPTVSRVRAVRDVSPYLNSLTLVRTLRL